MKKILLLARDPGGANTILALVPALEEKGYELLLYGKDAALHRYQHFGLEGKDITLELGVIDVNHWRLLLEREKPDIIITGTSGDDFSERYLWEAARIQGVPSFAILDQWVNYGLRFSPYGLNEKDEYEKHRLHPFMPDLILVMDEEARQEMIKEGIVAERILVSGQPYFDLIAAHRQKDNQLLGQETRAALQIAEDDYVITFVSESISQDYVVAPGENPYWGYDEISIVQELVQTLAPISRQKSQIIHLLIKKHPLEKDDNYRKICAGLDCGNLQIQVMERNVEPWQLVLASDLICGMSSMLLLESILLGKPTISIQIGLIRENPFILDQKGVLKSILGHQDLDKSLRDIIIDNRLTNDEWTMPTGAIDKVIQLMEECLCQS